jgi:pimeloyl-ACP methyl ester carboxylesterase
LEIEKADFFGYSNGGSIALQVAIRHPSLARRLIVASAMFKRDGCSPEVWESMKHATLQSMPSELQDAYLKSAPHPEQLQSFHDKCVKRMLEFADWRAEDIHSISAPTLIMIGDNDIVRPEHAVEMYRPLPQAQLAVLPGTDHMQLVQRTNWEASMVEAFLDTFLPMTPPQGDHHEGSTGTQHWRAMDQAPINRRSDVRVKFRVPFHTIQVFQRST